MIKGCQKKIILVKDTGSDFFEEAYFIIKSDTELPAATESDIVKEATKIVNDSIAIGTKRNKKKIRLNSKAISFIIGTILGAITAGIVFAFIL